MRNLGSVIFQPPGNFTKIINYGNYALDGEQGTARNPASRSASATLLAAEGAGCCRSRDWQTRTLRSREDILPAIEEVLRILAAADYSIKDEFAVRLSLEEALVNAIKHGHKDDPSKEVELRYQVTPDYLLAEIEDQGAGFKPEDVPDPFVPENLEKAGGRGLLLMRHFMTWVRFNDAGNCVALCRCRFNT